MNKIVACLAAGTALMIITPTLAFASVEDTGTGDAVVTLLEETTPPIYPGQDAWVVLPWTVSNAEAREFKVTSVSSDGVEIGYPENTGSYTSLYNDDTLVPIEIDFTALRVFVDPESAAPRVLNITLSYVSDSGQHTQVVTLPVAVDETEFVGEGIAIVDGVLGELGETETRWLSVGLLGLENSTHVELRVVDPGPFEVVYPAERDHSRPRQGAGLTQAQEDDAAIRFGSEGLDEDTYAVVIEASYYVGITRVVTLVERQILVSDDDLDEESEVFYDSRETVGRWIVNPNGTDTATTGQWDLTVPEETSWNNYVTQLGYTPSGSPGVITTGAAGSGTGSNDIDDGRTSAISPSIHLSADRDVELQFVYYFAYLQNSTAADYLRVSIVGESASTMLLQNTGKPSNNEAEWRSATFDLSDFAGQDIRILVEAADEGSGSLVEAAIADILVRTTD